MCLDRPVAGVKADAILLDNVRGARECVRHLIQTGHRRIAIITGQLKAENARERLQGYKEALRDADIAEDPALILEGDFREESGYRLGRYMIESKMNATALLVCNGVMTLGVMSAFEDLGVQCPDHMALATFDDPTVSHSAHSHLTAVVQPIYEMGARATTILLDRIEGKLTGEPTIVRVVPTLIVRDSTRLPHEKFRGEGLKKVRSAKSRSRT